MNDAGWVLEPITQDFLDTVGENPDLCRRSPEEARHALVRIQAGAVGRPSAQIEDTTFPVGPTDPWSSEIFRPSDTQRLYPSSSTSMAAVGVSAAPILTIGSCESWPLPRARRCSSWNTTAHPKRAIRSPWNRSMRSPLSVAAHGESLGVDLDQARGRRGRRGRQHGRRRHARWRCSAAARRSICRSCSIRSRMPISPTSSYQGFANGPWLTKSAMERFWDAYLPDAASRNEITAAPLRASVDQLRGLPDALIIIAENDVLRDEGEGYARQLLQRRREGDLRSATTAPFTGSSC